MNEYISKDKLRKKKKYIFQTESGAFPKSEWFYKFDDVESISSADVRENVHGEWILQYRDAGVEFYLCNKCNKGRAVIDGSFYKDLSEFKCCPECAADMRGKTK